MLHLLMISIKIFSRRKLYLLIIPTIVCNTVFSQGDTCYKKSFSDGEKVFQKMEIPPHFEGYEGKLNRLLIKKIDIPGILKTIPDQQNAYSDTSHVRCIISRTGKMSELTITGKNKVVQKELVKAWIASACQWKPGYSNGDLNGWYSAMVIFRYEKKLSAVSIDITSE